METGITNNNEKKEQEQQESWKPVMTAKRAKANKPTDDEIDRVVKNLMNDRVPDRKSEVNADAGNHVKSDDKDITDITKDDLQTNATESIVYTVPKRVSSKQRKESLEEYKEIFLQVPTIENRKPIFLSCGLRDKLDDLVRKLGGRKMSVSGFYRKSCPASF